MLRLKREKIYIQVNTYIKCHMHFCNRKSEPSEGNVASEQGGTRRRQDSRLTRRLILEAAERSFADCGFRNTTIAAIATELQMSPANVFKHFSSKEELARAVIETRLGGVRFRGVSPGERMAGFVRNALKGMLDLRKQERGLFEIMEMLIASPDLEQRFRLCLAAQVAQALSSDTETTSPRAECIADVLLAVLHPSIVDRTEEAVLKRRAENLLVVIKEAGLAAPESA
nr:TetR/AcrR family transcriptional regulator [Rhizobium sp. Q54]